MFLADFLFFHQRNFLCFKMKLFSVVNLIKFVIDENVW